jgi:hypothetical protein
MSRKAAKPKVLPVADDIDPYARELLGEFCQWVAAHPTSVREIIDTGYAKLKESIAQNTHLDEANEQLDEFIDGCERGDFY